MNLSKYLAQQSRLSLTLWGFVLAVLVGVVDYLTGPEISFSIFYLIPINMVAWQVSRRWGILLSVVSAALWLTADLLTGYTYSHPAVPYWNAVVRLGLFLIVTYALSALRTSQQRQEELGQFIVHDLRSPLANVMTGLQTMQEIASETMDAFQQDMVEMCLVSCNRMLTLINSLLDLAQLESGKMPLQPDDVGTEELAESSLGQVTVWAARNQVTLTSHLDPRVQTVYADSTAVVRVLVNLLSNAIKFSRPGSDVTVRVAPFDATMVAFSVTDEGPGIPKEWADKVFDKFAQIEARKAGGAVGSGLGLTFCRLAVEAQGGRIWLESETGKGTTVTFTLPALGSVSR
jgi:signal transduction histidine kinase